MKIINQAPNPSGAYSALQSWDDPAPPEGWALFPDEFYSTFYPSDKLLAGFVDITVEDGVVTVCTWNEEAYQAYLEEHPAASGEDAKVPTELEQLRADVDYLLMMTEG